MRVVMLTRPGCNQCAMMKHVLGDRVEYADVAERPDLTALTRYTSLPVFIVFDNAGQCAGSFYGMMPLAEFDRRLSLYGGR